MFLKVVALVLLICHLSVILVIIIHAFARRHEEDPGILSTEPDVPIETPQELLTFIDHLNTHQRILNEDLFGTIIDLAIVIQVHNRPLYLQEVINSLQSTPSINTTLLIFSHDLFDEVLNDMIQKIKFAKILQIFYPYSAQTHPREFPGPDSDDCQSQDEMLVHDCANINFRDRYGRLRNSSLSQIKHHWWWKANFVFREVEILRNYDSLVLFLEEDHYLAPDFLHCLRLMERSARRVCPRCWFFSLGLKGSDRFQEFANLATIRRTVETFGLAFNRTVWAKISKLRYYFCKFDDYNWDWSLKNLHDRGLEDKVSMVLAVSRVFHIGSCGTHFNGQTCDPTGAIESFKNKQMNLFPDSLVFLMYHKRATNDFKNNGGWGDPRDQDLCMEM